MNQPSGEHRHERRRSFALDGPPDAGSRRSKGPARANSQRGLSVPRPHRQHPCDGQEGWTQSDPTRLNDLVRDVLALTERDLQRSHISVELQLDEHLPWTKGDRVQLQQALINLITNAMANQKWPRILRITSAIEGPSGVVISVADTGKGINPKIVDRIFNPLFTTKSNGMGMGLAIADRSSRGPRVDFRRQSALKAAR
jgi:light-regulated signal transduction histidine kinase (bacteriophytochrome)